MWYNIILNGSFCITLYHPVCLGSKSGGYCTLHGLRQYRHLSGNLFPASFVIPECHIWWYKQNFFCCCSVCSIVLYLYFQNSGVTTDG